MSLVSLVTRAAAGRLEALFVGSAADCAADPKFKAVPSISKTFERTRREHSTMRIKMRNNYFLIRKECVCLIKRLPQSQSLNIVARDLSHATKGRRNGRDSNTAIALPATPGSLLQSQSKMAQVTRTVSGRN